jgi:uncharacterized membrane protein YhhN
MEIRVILRYVFLALLFVFSAVHLYHSWLDDKKRRKYTKPFLLLFIIAYYIVSADKLSVLLILALATSWLGDVLLIPEGHGWFTAGGISFMFTHILFIIVYASKIDFSSVLWALVIPAAVIYYGISAVIIYKLRPTTPKIMLIPMYFYLLSNSTMNVFSLMQLTSLRSAGAAVAYVGAVLFFISDCTLFLVRYHKNKDLIFKRHFTVMLTYIVGELLITQGVLMLG